MKDTNFADDYPFIEQNTLSLKDDDPKWLETEHAKREISLELTIILHKERDAGKPDRVQPAVVVRIVPVGNSLEKSVPAYLQSSCVSCAAMICQVPFRLSQVSVQTRHRDFVVPSFAFPTELS